VVFLEGSALGRPPSIVRPAWLPHAPRGLFALAAIAYAVACVGLTRWFMGRGARPLMVGLAALAVAAGAALLLVVSWHVESRRQVVVLAADGVLLRKGDARSFPPRYETPLHKGVECDLLFRRDGWLQVELSGGEVGWIAAGDAVVEDG
jgi:hypothetical protein